MRIGKNFQFGKFKKIQFGNFEKLVIWEIKKKSILKMPKICNVENSKNLHFL